MKKKTYIAPKATVTNVEMAPILAGSLDSKNTNGSLAIRTDYESTEGWAAAKHYDVWADDEE